MKNYFFLCIVATAASITTCLCDTVPWERLEKNNSMLLILDLQDGLYGLARDFDPTVYHNAMVAHSAVGKIFNIPVVMTTSAQQGPNGPLPKKILDIYPDAPLVMRQGEVNAWDNEEFRAAVKATGKKQIIMGGIVTDVCKSSTPNHCLRQQSNNIQAQHSSPYRFVQKATASGPTSKPRAPQPSSSATFLMIGWRERACSS